MRRTYYHPWRSPTTTKGEYDQAIADFAKALELNPNYADAYRVRGLAYAYKKEYDQAVADFSKTLELNPDVAATYALRGAAYASQRGV